MQELQVNLKPAVLEIIDKEKFEQGINEVVTKYGQYTVTASTIKDDKQVLADLRKLDKQISDTRIAIKKELSEPATEIDKYIKEASEPLKQVIGKIAGDVKEFEEHQKALRLDTVKSYIANKASEYMLDPRLFDEKTLGYIKASDFKADGVTLKKATMQSLDDLVTFEYQNQQEQEKAKATISSQCAEYGMTDQPYIRMLEKLTVVEVLEQIKADHQFELQKAELEKRRAEQDRQQETAQKSTQTPQKSTQANENTIGGVLCQNKTESIVGAKNGQKRYTQKMTLEVYFEDTEDKERFKKGLSSIGFEFKKNYQVSGYQTINPLTQEELNDEWGW